MAYYIAHQAVARGVQYFAKQGACLAEVVWMVNLQTARREAFIHAQRQIKEQGFWRVMWPKMLLMAVMFGLWVLLLMWIF